jgi:uncharacterized membrane protein
MKIKKASMGETAGSEPGRNGAEVAAGADELVRTNVRTITDLEAVARLPRTREDRIIDAIAHFCGSLTFFYVHALWFGLWIAINLSPIQSWHFDPFPFSLLGVIAALEAIFLATSILLIQNRQTELAERRSHLELQINLLAEQENTKMLAMLEAIQHRLGIPAGDPEVAALKQATELEKLVEEIERHVEEPGAEAGPSETPEGHQGR